MKIKNIDRGDNRIIGWRNDCDSMPVPKIIKIKEEEVK